MQLITLTTDWGYSDHYIGAVKAKLHSLIGDCQIIDISHNVEKFSILHGAFIVKNSCLNFPKGTIHIIDIDCTESIKLDYQNVVVEYCGQFFITTDNGLLSLVFEEPSLCKIVNIRLLQDSTYSTFLTLDLFCKTAASLAKNKDISILGSEISELNKKNSVKPITNTDFIELTVEHVDSYGNIFFNMKIEEFSKIIGSNSFSLNVETTNISTISESYDDVEVNTPLLTVASTSNLQLAINKANASELLGYNMGSRLSVKIIHK